MTDQITTLAQKLLDLEGELEDARNHIDALEGVSFSRASRLSRAFLCISEALDHVRAARDLEE
jgi:hypothetical protein